MPALIPKESFARSQELLHENKMCAQRRMITPSIVQGLVSCKKCGHAFSRTSMITSARKIRLPLPQRVTGSPIGRDSLSPSGPGESVVGKSLYALWRARTNLVLPAGEIPAPTRGAAAHRESSLLRRGGENDHRDGFRSFIGFQSL